MARRTKINQNYSKSISECVTAFEKSCIIKNLKKPTIHTYLYECNCFQTWFGEDRFIHEITEEVIEDYIVFIKDSNISQTYVSTKIRQLRVFLYFCMEREYMKSFKIKVPKADEVIKEPYTTKELERLIKKPTSDNWVEWRTWAMVNYMVATGNRISTVLNIKISDLDFEYNRIKLRVLKTRRQEYIPMSSELTKALKLYLSLWEHTDNNYLFPEYEGGQLSKSGATEALRKYNINRGVTKTSAHLFRHTFAKNYIVAGGDSVYLQRLLGHSTLAMTNHYVRLYSTDLQKNYDQYNPLDNLMQKRGR